MKKTAPIAPICRSLKEAADWLERNRVAHAASLRVTLPEGLDAPILHTVDDLAALKRQAVALGAVIATGRDAASVSKAVAQLNRPSLMSRILPAAKADEEAAPPLSLNIEDALRNETPQASAPVKEPALTEEPAEEARPILSLNIEDAIANETPIVPQEEEIPAAPVIDETADAPAEDVPAPVSREPAAAPREGVTFLLLIDSLDSVPSLAELPGAQPDLVIIGEITAGSATVNSCLAEITACNADAHLLSGTQPFVMGVDPADLRDIAERMLRRGLTTGYVSRLAGALQGLYGLSLPQAVAHAEMALRRAVGETVDVPELPALRLRDVDDLVRAIRRPQLDKKFTDEVLAAAVHAMLPPRAAKHALDTLMDEQRELFASGVTLDVKFRVKQLRSLLHWVETHEAAIENALMTDLGKCAFEAYETEIFLVKEELRTFIRHLPGWQRDRRVAAPIAHWPSRCRTVRNPYGLALIMSPWNYPFLLTVDPLIAAIGGGNCVILKPSAYAPATSALIKEMADELFDPEYVAVIEGGRQENQALLEKKFDTIFFTGSVNVGKVVMKSAAEHLTPVTLELGGKSPCIVDATADVVLAARRIAWGKFINAGQTCVAPDYVLCHASVKDRLVAELGRAIEKYYGQDPVNNPELCHIINQTHFDRLCGLMEGMEIAHGGQTDPEVRKIAPTVLHNVTWDDAVMQEEIFGPILPILTWEGDMDDLVPMIEDRPRPLAAYLFTADKRAEEVFLRRLRFGGGCVNDVICHLATSRMPFGGVGESGMGRYHGKYGFDTFTHEKAILKKSRKIDLPVRYAPYGEKKIKLLRKL